MPSSAPGRRRWVGRRFRSASRVRASARVADVAPLAERVRAAPLQVSHGGTVKPSSKDLVVGLVAMLLAVDAARVAAQEHTRVKTPAVPGEQAPPADPGQKNFGAPIVRPGTGGTRPPAPPRWPAPKFGTVPLAEIVMSDPFVYADEKTHTYYLIGSGGRLYKSPDLKMWTGPYSVIDLTGTWMDGHFVAAAEIHP